MSSSVNSKYTLTDKLWKCLQDYAAKHKAKGNGFGYGLNRPDQTARTLSLGTIRMAVKFLSPKKAKAAD